MKIPIIEQVIADLELEQKGATLFYAVDPYDIVSFCFPVPSKGELRPLDDIADEQAAFYEVVFGRQPQPLMLAEYGAELDSIFDYLKRHIQEAHEKTRVVEALISRIREQKTDLAHAILGHSERNAEETDFNIVLAVVMGIYTLGIQRFREVSERLSRPDDPQLQPVLWQLDAEYQESPQTEWLERQILDLVPKKKKASARTDARAIDRLFFVNSGLERALKNKSLTHRYIFLYLSSANRSTEIFGLPEVQRRFPVIDGKFFSLHRTPEHIFTMLTSRGAERTTPRIEVAKSIEALKSTLKLLRADQANQLNRKFSAQLQQDCRVCIKDGAPAAQCAACPNLISCQAMLNLSERYNEHRVRAIQNLGLLSIVKRYQELRTAVPGSPDEAKFLNYFRRAGDDDELQMRSHKRIEEYHKLIQIQLEFKKFLSTSQVDHSEMQVQHQRKVVHLFFPYAGLSEKYSDVFQQLRESELAHSFEEKLRFYDGASKAFTSIDAPSERIAESHELVRCILYLACPTSAGDMLAYEHAREMLDEHKTQKSHFWTILSLVAPRLLYFEKGEWYAQEGIGQFPDDPRLHYARALNKIRWLRAQTDHEDRAVHLADAITEQQLSISLCQRQTASFKRLLAMGFNNLVAYCCFEDWGEGFDRTKLTLAREALHGLKREFPKEEWPTEDIDFFRTEAQLEYYEALNFKRQGRLEEAAFKLTCAQREIAFALNQSPKDSYKTLLRTIEAEAEAIARIVAVSEPAALASMVKTIQ